MRPFIRKIHKAAKVGAALVVIGGVMLHLDHRNPFTLEQYEGNPEKVTAEVVAKIRSHSSVELPQKDGKGTWQPKGEVSSSAHNLVVAIPGHVGTAVIPVSADVYSKYCTHVNDAGPALGKKAVLRVDNFSPCGPTFKPNGESSEPTISGLDKIDLIITRGMVDGEVRVHGFTGVERFAESRSEKRALLASSIPEPIGFRIQAKPPSP